MARFIPAFHLLVMAALSPVATSGSAAAQSAEITTYRGACDGSAAVALNQNFFAVADDDSNVLNIYRAGQEGAAVSELNLDAFLEAPTKKKPGPDGKPVFKEADIEGAARIDDRIYWISSHGRDSDGEVEPGRARLFATRIAPHPDGRPRLEPIKPGAYMALRDKMLDKEETLGGDKALRQKLAEAYYGLDNIPIDKSPPDEKKDGPAPESDNGFNIEGLAATPDGALLIGFRNPRPGNNAVVIRLDNPVGVVDEGKTPVFGHSWQLEGLGGRGIRSIERINNSYVIVAGPHLDAEKSNIKPPFALYIWSGKQGDNKVDKMEGVAIPDDFRPEAMFAVPESSSMVLLSDDGTKECKKAEKLQKTFRALTVLAPK